MLSTDSVNPPFIYFIYNTPSHLFRNRNDVIIGWDILKYSIKNNTNINETHKLYIVIFIKIISVHIYKFLFINLMFICYMICINYFVIFWSEELRVGSDNYYTLYKLYEIMNSKSIAFHAFVIVLERRKI